MKYSTNKPGLFAAIVAIFNTTEHRKLLDLAVSLPAPLRGRTLAKLYAEVSGWSDDDFMGKREALLEIAALAPAGSDLWQQCITGASDLSLAFRKAMDVFHDAKNYKKSKKIGIYDSTLKKAGDLAKAQDEIDEVAEYVSPEQRHNYVVATVAHNLAYAKKDYRAWSGILKHAIPGSQEQHTILDCMIDCSPDHVASKKLSDHPDVKANWELYQKAVVKAGKQISDEQAPIARLPEKSTAALHDSEDERYGAPELSGINVAAA